MTQRHLAGARILAQGLLDPGPGQAPTPTEVTRVFGAHQGQDVAGVMASLALRTGGELDPVLGAFDRGEIVRGYPMRGTVFAVAADTLAWLTQLCAAGPIRAATKRRPALGLEDAHVVRAEEVLEDVAAEHSTPGAGRGVLRAELLETWQRAGIPTDRGRGYHLLTHLISTGTAAYGPWRGNETAVVLARTWLPAGSDLEGSFNGEEEAAIAELARRYFTSHGPASVRDLAWWSKLPMGRIRSALPQIEEHLETGFADTDGRLHRDAATARGGGEQMWWRPGLAEEYARREKEAMRELLLPGFDELVLGYPDRLYLLDEAHHQALVPGRNGVFKRAAVRRGQVVATWGRTGSAGRRRLELQELVSVSDAQRRRLEKLFAAFPYTVA
ncbi:MAG TPA: winged helix DNA-binding domain-containing protein [Candidatus Brachybacterium merdavium]|uniref:Winged helix DNA-binding domain-containing protein n=1 Tax=Candidatus Brachybacterium merdavium TaxID=2838513 RepID=A0A9D2LCZ2_9MICO|nr:winged helix DNA-binding domain-containing protein [Candidatus Brachybacterium merdavium]